MQVTELQYNASSIYRFLRLLKIRVAVFKCLGHLIKKVYSHIFASKTRLIYFSHFPEILVYMSYIVLKI